MSPRHPSVLGDPHAPLSEFPPEFEAAMEKSRHFYGDQEKMPGAVGIQGRAFEIYAAVERHMFRELRTERERLEDGDLAFACASILEHIAAHYAQNLAPDMDHKLATRAMLQTAINVINHSNYIDGGFSDVPFEARG